MKRFTITSLVTVLIAVLLMGMNSAKAQHFDFQGGNPADPVWTLYVAGATLDGTDLEAGDEIGVFDGETLVGAFTLTQVCTPDNQFENNIAAFSTLNNGDGYQPGNPVTLKCWDASEEVESVYFEVEWMNPYGDAWTETFFPEGDGVYSIPVIEFSSTPPAGTVEGTVSLNGGNGDVTNATVEVEGITSTNPDAEGFYTLSLEETGTYDIMASLDGYYPVTEEGVYVEVGQTVTVDFTLNPVVGTLEGTVTDVSGNPVEGATVNAQGPGSYEVTTSSDGTFSISDVLVGSYTVEVTAGDYYSASQENVTVEDGQVTTLEFMLEQPYWEFNGGNPADPVWTVYLAEGTLDGMNLQPNDEIALFDGETLVGHYVLEEVLTPDEQFEHFISAFSTLNNGDGYTPGNPISFQCYDASNDEVFAGFEVTFDDPYGDAWTEPFFPEGDGVYSLVHIDYFSAGAIEGYVTDAVSSEAVEGAEVAVEGTSLSATTDDQGYYLIENVQVGTHDVTASADLYEDQTVTGVEVSGGETAQADFTLTPTIGHLSGVVTDDYTGNPIEGVMINVEGTSFTAETNASGEYEIINIPVGAYDVTATHDDYLSATANAVIEPGLNTSLDFALTYAYGSIAGTVTAYDSGNSLEGVTVTASSQESDETYETTTDANGEYIMNNVAIGTYDVSTEVDDYHPDTVEDVMVESNQTTETNFTLYPVHFDFQGGNPADPVWTVFLSSATLDDMDLQPFDEIAIYDGETMVGSFVLTEVLAPENQFDNPLIAFSTLTNGNGYTPGNPYTFKCYDASEGIESGNVDVELFDPYGDAYTGDVFPEGDGVYSIAGLDFVTTVTQNYSLVQGFQFISARVEPLNPDMLELADPILDDLDFVRNTDGSMLRKIGPNWINNIGNWVATEGYLFRMDNPSDDLSIEGYEVDPETPIDLAQGFQFVSYLPDYEIDALAAVDGILDNLDFVRSSDGSMLRKIGPNWINNIGNLIPNEGYLVRMNATDQLVYNLAKSSVSSVEKTEAQHFEFRGGNPADPVYTMYIQPGNGINPGDEVAAYDGDKLVGSTVITGDTYKNDLSIFRTLNEGDGYKPGNKITLKYWNHILNKEQHVDVTFKQPYGDTWSKPVYPAKDGEYSVMKVGRETQSVGNEAAVALYPNPANSVVTITSGSTIDEMHIYDVNGRLVGSFRPGDRQSEINIENYENGVYVVKILTKSTSYIKRLIVN